MAETLPEADMANAAPAGADGKDAELGGKVLLTHGGKEFPVLPRNLFPGSFAYVMGYFSSMHAIVGTVLTMYITVVAQVAANAALSPHAPLTWKLVWALDIFYPIVIMAAVLWVAWEIECRRFVFYELMKNGYLISFEASHNDLKTLNYWLRPNFGYFPHIALVATIMLAISTHAAQASLSVIVIQLSSLFLFYGELINMESTTPPVGVFVAKHRFFIDEKTGEESEEPEVHADTPSKYDIYQAITNVCQTMERFTVVNEEDIRKDVRYMMLTPDGWFKDKNNLINAFGDGGAAPIGRMAMGEPVESIIHKLLNFMMNMMTGGMWGRLWATKIVLCLVVTKIFLRMEKLKPFRPIHAHPNIIKRMPFMWMMFACGWVAALACFCIEIYGIYVGVKTARAGPPSPPPACYNAPPPPALTG